MNYQIYRTRYQMVICHTPRIEGETLVEWPSSFGFFFSSSKTRSGPNYCVRRNVSFKYAGSEADALHNVSFKILSGQLCVHCFAFMMHSD